MKKHRIALIAMTAICAMAPTSSFAQIYKICDFYECCYVDSDGNGHCYDLNVRV